MSSLMPITLIGDNLGARHKYLNTLVRDAYNGDEDFTSIQQVSEKTPLDRLFKIDLASKRQDVNYIIENLKDDDMLYVSRALKSKWLLDIEYQNIINPVNLEENLFPHMITTAVRKMKHWIHLNLKDNRRSEEFYKFYCDKEFKLAIKFLTKSSKEFIAQEFTKIMYNVSPRQFKLLCETCYQVANIFFCSLSTDERLKSQYLEYHKEYFKSLKFLLKTDPNTFFNIVEKYFNVAQFEKFSPNATKLVIQKHKDRFLKKPELYAVRLLDMKTLSANLSAGEAKELVEKLAKAKYVQTWFSYKNVEPLIKRLKLEERAVFKKKIFVAKDVGKKIENCPYVLPSPLILTKTEPSIFDDREHSPSEYIDLLEELDFRCMLKKRKYAKWGTCQSNNVNRSTKTVLDQLFDKYRFVGFDKTLFELRNQIKAESSKERRQYMILVLVSKAGGCMDALANLLNLLVAHRNEPSNLRAAVIRSLVKRSFIWRLSDENWQKLLDFAYNLGLDGKLKECECVEGLHAVILRHFLSGATPAAELMEVFLTNFTTFSEYSLSCEEKIKVSNVLPKTLLDNSSNEKDNIPTAVKITEKLLNTLDVYKIPVSTYPGLITHIKYLAEKDLLSTNPLIERLYKAKIARRQLFEINFNLFKSDESYLDALRHKANILQKEMYEIQTLNKNNKSEKFFRKLAIYFNEENGIGQHVLKTLKLNITSRNLARPIALLTKDDIDTLINNVQTGRHQIVSRLFIAAIKANAHVIRPLQKLETLDWKSGSTKLIANKVITCRQKDVEKSIKELLKYKKTMGVALVLSDRSVSKNEVFTTVSLIRPTKTIKSGLVCIRKECDIDSIWKIIKPLIENLDLTSKSKQYLLKSLTAVDNIPLNIKAEYNKVIFKLFQSTSYYEAMPYLCHIENLLPNNDEDFIEKVLFNWMTEYFSPDKLNESFSYLTVMNLHIRVLVKHILLSETEEEQNHRLNTLGQTFFDQLKAFWNRSINEKKEGNITLAFFESLNEVLLTLKYTKVFIDPRYQSCLPVMVRFETWFNTIIPFEKNFDIYLKLRLTMLYYNAIKQSSENDNNIFVNEKNKSNGTKLVGYNFGKCIALEVNNFCNKYFESIVNLYKDSLLSYLDVYFCTVDFNFIEGLIEGIFDNGVNSVLILGVYLFKHYEFNVETKHRITSSLKKKNVREVIFFLNS